MVINLKQIICTFHFSSSRIHVFVLFVFLWTFSTYSHRSCYCWHDILQLFANNFVTECNIINKSIENVFIKDNMLQAFSSVAYHRFKSDIFCWFDQLIFFHQIQCNYMAVHTIFKKKLVDNLIYARVYSFGRDNENIFIFFAIRFVCVVCITAADLMPPSCVNCHDTM